MTQGVKDLISAIASGDSVAIDNAFNAEMATRISGKLEDMRVEVAQGMFREQEEVEIEEEELSDEFIDAILESLTEEDDAEIDAITEEQIEEASYSAKAAKAGKDIGKPGKNFAKIAAKAAKKYGSEEKGRKVAGAVLAKLRKDESVGDVAQKGVDIVKKIAGVAVGTVGAATGALDGIVKGARKAYHSVAD